MVTFTESGKPYSSVSNTIQTIVLANLLDGLLPVLLWKRENLDPKFFQEIIEELIPPVSVTARPAIEHLAFLIKHGFAPDWLFGVKVVNNFHNTNMVTITRNGKP
jgi:hypothetical protein